MLERIGALEPGIEHPVGVREVGDGLEGLILKPGPPPAGLSERISRSSFMLLQKALAELAKARQGEPAGGWLERH